MNSSKTTTYNGTLDINELSKTGRKSFTTYKTTSDEKGPVNDVSSNTEFNNGKATTTLHPRAVYIFVQQ